ncbi:putative membrane protein [Anoxybacillus tepidamans]|uniref:Putative membrane protein n=1 Tax=Anoxybacteroides tepidamans TaxID=265948 RepID=A0A7W8MVX6_9BACL|nr:YhgE/Pip domain-containing protein [Anoxybacillus tepidamans]MBB5325378.1 putative membrane protein [Anoxybacillus tepidamans]
MKSISLFVQELKSMATNRKVLVPVLAVLFIPLLYSGMFLWAFWDPYAHLDELPVAVVNNDKGAVFNGEKLEIGDELVKKLKENKKFAWHFVSEKEAEKGLKQQTYYMVVKIPENFSENATTIQDEHPKRMTLIYMPNESFNFLSAQIGNTAVEKIKEELSHTVTATYAETMFDNVQKMAKGLQDASDGAKQVHDGVSAAKDGAVKLQDGLHSAKEGSGQLKQGANVAKNGAAEIYKNLKVLAEKSLAFENGLKSASDGSERLNGGLKQLNDGFVRMQEGQSQLLDGAKQVEDGTKQLSGGLKQSLAGMEQMKEKVPQLTTGTLQLKNGASNLASSLEQWKQGAENTKAGAVQVSDGLQQIIAQLDAIIAQTADANEKATLQTLKNSLLPLSEGSKQVAGGMAQLSDGAGALKTGADQLVSGASQLYEGGLAFNQAIEQLFAGQQKLVAGADALVVGQGKVVQGLTAFGEKMAEAKNGVSQLASGSGQLSSGLRELADGSTRLQNGVSQLAAGAEKLSGGMARLEGGISQLSNGVNQLSDGSDQLVDGMKKLDDGSKELAAKLSDGAKKAGDVKANNDIYHMFAEPVKMKNERIYHVPNYGTGFTPYFLSLGLFVGALLLSIVFPLREPAGIPSSGLSWFLSKFSILVIVGVIQALLADTVLLAGLGLDVQSVPNFIIFSIITSITFITLIQFLVTTLGDPGRFVGIIILILQLTTSAGTFPLELIPKTLQPFNAYLPMTYSVFGFKAVISSGDFTFMWENIAILAIFIAVLSIGTILYFTVQHKRKFYTMTQNMTEAPKA